jgi:vitamin B12 transporter
MNRLRLFAASAAGLAFATHAFADELGPVDVGELVVTATRSPQPIERVGQSITVVTAEELKASQAVAVSDLLATTPGVSFSRNGGVGGATALRIRGAESDQTVVVIDGVKLNDPSSTGGGYNFANLLAGDIARIEVLRGAQSTLWGSQAIGGVVNVVTALPDAPFEGGVEAEAGSRGTAYVRAGVGGAGERLTWRLAASRYETDGLSTYRFGTEKDGYRHTGLSARAEIRASDAVSIDLRGVWSKGRNDFDGFPPPAYSFSDTREYGETEDLVLYSGVNFDLLDGALKNRVAYGYTRTDRDNFNPDQPLTPRTFDAKGENRRWEYQGVWTINPAWTATFGAEAEDAKMRSAAPSQFTPNPPAFVAKAGLDGVYAQVQGEVLAGLTLTAGVRRDEHETFGGKTLGQVAAAWSLNGGATVLRASFGQGFKAPTLYQLFSEYGNQGLAPEEADGWDAGITQRFFDSRLAVSATWFGRETRNQIDFFSCAAATTNPLCFRDGVRRSGVYDNIAQTKAHGVELEAKALIGPLDLEANYTWTDAENDSPGANRGRKLARRPEHQANIKVAYVWENGGSLAGALRYVGDSYDDPANTYVMPAYALLDLRASWPVTDKVDVHGRIENAFDEAYETTRNYGSPGRGAYVGVRARF